MIGREWPWHVSGTVLVVSERRCQCQRRERHGVTGYGDGVPAAALLSSCRLKAKSAMAQVQVEAKFLVLVLSTIADIFEVVMQMEAV